MLRRKLGTVLTTLGILALCGGAGAVLWMSHAQRTSEMLAEQQAREALAQLPMDLGTHAPATMGTLRRLSDTPPADLATESPTPSSSPTHIDTPTAAAPVLSPAAPPLPDYVPLSGESKSLGGDTRSAFLPAPPTDSLNEGTG